MNPLNPHLVASADDVIEQIQIQCWLFETRTGDRAGARGRAERTLERLLTRGLPYRDGPGGLLLDPYEANNRLKSRVGEPADEAWTDWQRTTRRNAVSLPSPPHLYRFSLRREWPVVNPIPGRPVMLRLPLPLRHSQQGPAQVRLLEPAGALVDLRESPGRVELLLDAAAIRGPVVAELDVRFVAGEVRDSMAAAAAVGAPVEAEDQLWLREREGLITRSSAVAHLAAPLAKSSANAREFAESAWRWMMLNLRFGDVHYGQLDPLDPMGGLLQTRLADCVLGSSLMVALCRAAGVPARVVSGYLLHPANLGPHSWAEIRLAPDRWVPFDFGSWCYSAGDPDDPEWGNFFRGRVDARYLAEVAPRQFTGWGSVALPEHWYRLERLEGRRMQHTLHALPQGTLFRRDLLDLEILGPA